MNTPFAFGILPLIHLVGSTYVTNFRQQTKHAHTTPRKQNQANTQRMLVTKWCGKNTCIRSSPQIPLCSWMRKKKLQMTTVGLANSWAVCPVLIRLHKLKNYSNACFGWIIKKNVVGWGLSFSSKMLLLWAVKGRNLELWYYNRRGKWYFLFCSPMRMKGFFWLGDENPIVLSCEGENCGVVVV